VSTQKAPVASVDLTQFKCPRSLIELKIGLSSLKKGHCINVTLNTKHNNQDIFNFLATSSFVIEASKKEEMIHTLTLIKS
jgi:TusA-related sulfurtransferase